MQKRQNGVAPESLRTASVGELLAETQTGVEGADEGLRLISAFLRIRDPALRAAVIDFVSEFSQRSEQV
jgi:hypothetical protein